MQLAGLILFVFSILGLMIWILKFLLIMGSTDTFINKKLHGISPVINIAPLLISLLLIAISAGMAWG
ncbi:MAG: hypothetical protein COA44_13820 [Arcobacter sp.]|nr:MAG: hypothetical protein COA44_13820 [Arcobacter sp.]